jgi:hypothetical protein
LLSLVSSNSKSTSSEASSLHKRPSPRASLIAGIVAVIVFAGAVASNLIASDLQRVLQPFNRWVWLTGGIALVVAVAAAVVEVRRRTQSSGADAPGSTVNGNAERSAAFANVNRSTIVTGDKNLVGNEIDGDNVGRDKIIIHQSSSSAAATLTQAHEIPPPPADFTGREDELRELLTDIEVGGVTISGLHGWAVLAKPRWRLSSPNCSSHAIPTASSFSILEARAHNRSAWLRLWPMSSALTIPPTNSLKVKAICVGSISPCSTANPPRYPIL